MKRETTMEMASEVFPMMVERMRDQAISYIKLAIPLRIKRRNNSGRLRKNEELKIAKESE